MKNYYDELEISKTASKEVIEKVYKVLAKKYHPDTTQELDKKAAEEKFKIISEAYEVLSDDEKRKKYDLELAESEPTISYEEYINIVNQRDSLNESFNNLKNEYNKLKTQQYNTHIPYNQVDFNYNNPSYNSQNINNNNTTNNNSKSPKTKYYYTNSGKPASAFDYYFYKIKEAFRNLGILLLVILVLILMLNSYFNLNLLNLFL